MRKSGLAKYAVHNFPSEQLDRVNYEAIVRTPAQIDQEARQEAVTAMDGAVSRHRAARDAAEALAPLLEQSVQSEPGWHYKIHTRLFEFIVSLNSSIESSAFGLYFIGSVLAPEHFGLLVDEKKRKHITPVSTVKAYKAAWPDEPLTAALAGFAKDPDHKKLLDRRNMLAHRIAPRLEFRIGPQVGLPPNAAQQNFAVAAFGEPVVTLIPTTLARAEELLTELWTAAAGFAVRCSREFRAS